MEYEIAHDSVTTWNSNIKFHAMLCDPPYHLTSITKRFGKPNSAPAKHGTDGAFARASRGFMNQEWDGGTLAFQRETWAKLGEHLFPGAFCMAFAASRNWHRMAVAIEDAGFAIHPTIWLWVHSGMPKATRVDNQVEGELADVWKGRCYGQGALKPCVEPIIVFQKPYEGRPVDNIVATGAGTYNIDGTRVGNEFTRTAMKDLRRAHSNQFGKPGISTPTICYKDNPPGRWPANLILDGGTAEMLDAQSGTKPGKFVRNRTKGARPFNNGGTPTEYTTDEVIEGDSGGASMYFQKVQHTLEESQPVVYHSKVMPGERNAGVDGKNPHPTLKPISLTRYLAKMLLPPDEYAPRRLLVPFSGAGSEMIGGILEGWDFVQGIEQSDDYIEVAKQRIKHHTSQIRLV